MANSQDTFDGLNAQIETLTAQVEANTTIEGSAVTLIQGIAAKLAAAGTDAGKLQALQSQLGGSAQALAAAIAANAEQDTPPADNPPADNPPADTPPADTGGDDSGTGDDTDVTADNA